MNLIKVVVFFCVIAYFMICCGGASGDLRELINEENGNFIVSEKLNYKVDTIATGLKNPWGLTFLPNQDLLVTEHHGEIRVIRNAELLEDRIYGVPEVYNKGQGGLFEVQLHPQYDANGIMYISYAAPGNEGGNTAIMKARLDDLKLVDKQVIFQAYPIVSGGNHFGGRMEFDREGYLYLTVGERGSKSNAQDLGNHSGKVFRLTENGDIPTDNPFVNTDNARPEIYTYGNRNPQGMAIHPETGEIWMHEHGPRGGDEINIIQPGANYGWPEATFGKNYSGTTISKYTSLEGMEDPLHYWDPSIAPCGMSFVTSKLFNPWKGNLLVGSLKFRYVARLELDGKQVLHEEKIIENLGRVRAIAEGPDGYIYVSTESPGMVVRLIPQ